MMTFNSAFGFMRNGYKVKRAPWGGYWRWDDAKATIIIHTKEGQVLEFAEVADLHETFKHIFKDDWQLVLDE